MESRALFSAGIDKKSGAHVLPLSHKFHIELCSITNNAALQKSIFSSVNDVVYIHITTKFVAVVKRVVVQTCDAHFG